MLCDKYKEILEQGNKFQIIFVSADQDEGAAKDYYADMPWSMLDFDDQETKDAFDEVFNVEGIPTLVLLEENGKLITTDGSEAILTCPFENISKFAELKRVEEEKKAAELAALRADFKWSTIFDEKSLLDGESNSVPLSSLEGKIVGLYFR
jgi:nucleoredoxin